MNKAQDTFREEIHYWVMKRLQEKPDMTQRELAEELGVSLGKVNYCLKALVKKGSLKVKNFRNSNNKRAYAYLLTPKGIEEKARMTVDFLRWKTVEYEQLRIEIETLKLEADRGNSTGDPHE